MSAPRTEAGKRLLKLAIEAEADSSTWNTAGYLFITDDMVTIGGIEAEAAHPPLELYGFDLARPGSEVCVCVCHPQGHPVRAEAAPAPLDALDVERLARAIALACDVVPGSLGHSSIPWCRAHNRYASTCEALAEAAPAWDAIRAALRDEGDTT